ncbi:MAG: protein-glutamate O-methyltransferase CheR [Acidobacteriota bacterium]
MAVPLTPRGGAPHDQPVEEIEIDLLLEAVHRQFGYDFRDYARTSIRRRVWKMVRAEGLDSISALQGRVLHEPAAWERFVQGISVNVSAMFRDPHFFRAFRRHAVPVLRTYPFIRIWQAGCSLGEEAYSLAILLAEEGLYDRSLIYATDINDATLRRAREGIYPAELMQKYTQNYLQAGGTRSFSEYYTARYEFALMRPSLHRNIVFSQHNLVSDGPFNEFNVVLCRNVMIYFNRDLQERTHRLLHDSLTKFGVLGLGAKESLQFMALQHAYAQFEPGEKLYRRIA